MEESVTRREVLRLALGAGGAVLLGGAITACSTSPADTSAGSLLASSDEPTPALSTSTAVAPARTTPLATVALPATHPWLPSRYEIEPGIKSRAALLVEAIGAWGTSGAGRSAARTRIAHLGFAPGLVDLAAPLLGAGTHAVAQVRDVQYGGLLSSSASVLIVVDQWRALASGAVRAGGTTLDVRLTKASPHWRVVDVLPARPGARAARIGASGMRALSDSRIRLPYAAAADIRAGRIHDSVLVLLREFSAAHIVDVSILRSGHPLHVFGTSRASDHPRGQAVDLWGLDSRPFINLANHSLAEAAMRFAVAHGAYNVGGPVLLNGSQYFSDRTHHDHVHIGFNR